MNPSQSFTINTDNYNRTDTGNYEIDVKGKLSFDLQDCINEIDKLKRAKPVFCDQYGMPSPIGYSGNLLLEACIKFNTHVHLFPIPSIEAVRQSGGTFKQRSDGTMMIVYSRKRRN